MLTMSGRAVINADNPSNTACSCPRSTASSPRNAPSSFCAANPSIISAASTALIGAGRNCTSAIASATMPPTPSITLAPNCGSRTTPAINSRLPEIIGAINSDTSPSAGVALAKRSVAAASTAVLSTSLSRTKPRSVLCAIAAPHSFTTTG